MTRWFLADLRTGRQILDLNVLTGTWAAALNQPETLEVTVDLQDPATVSLGLFNSAATSKTVLGCAEGDVIMGAGPVWSRSYDMAARTLKLSAKGIWSYYDHRYVEQLLAATVAVTQFTIPDAVDPTKTVPNPALTTTISNSSLGAIAAQLVALAQSWTGGSVPVILPSYEVGTRTRSYLGAEFQNLGDALRQLSSVENGPDIVFQPQFTADRLGIQWLLRVGTEAQPLLFADATHHWDVTLPNSPLSALIVDEDATHVASLAWLTGGRSSDDVLVSRKYDSTLVDRGFPLFEVLDSSHSSISDQATLDAYGAEATLYGKGAVQVWSFVAEAHSQPLLGTYQVGDFCELTVGAYNPATGAGDPYLPAGTYRQRIIGMSGDEHGEKVKIACAPSRG